MSIQCVQRQKEAEKAIKRQHDENNLRQDNQRYQEPC